MGSPSAPDRDAIVGDTPNLAARLQDHAQPGTLLVSQATYQLVRGWFLMAPRGELSLKGYDEPVPAYEVLDEAPSTSRIEVQADLSPFIGRRQQVEDLVEAWDAVAAGGERRPCVIRGEAGVGKSRLADVLRRRVEADRRRPPSSPTARAIATHTALYPVRRLIERAAGIEPGQAGDLRCSRLWSTLDDVGLTDALPVVRRPARPARRAVVPGVRARRRPAPRGAAPVAHAVAGDPHEPRRRCCSSSTTCSGPTPPPSTSSAGSRGPRPGAAPPDDRPRRLHGAVAAGRRRRPRPPHRRRAPASSPAACRRAGASTPSTSTRSPTRSDGIPLFLEELLRTSGVAEPRTPSPTQHPRRAPRPAPRPLRGARASTSGSPR